ncbi:phytoene/squalene synthase family protein [Anaerolineales bacterium]
MAVQTWETSLLQRAYEAYDSPVMTGQLSFESHLLEDAYLYCKQITKSNSRTFYMAASLLPEPKQAAVHALYAFCRSTDDLIDKWEGKGDPHQALNDWRLRLHKGAEAFYDPIPMAWAHVQRNFELPHGYADQLIQGIETDLSKTRYKTFSELTEYCYAVASTVGLIVMHIIGFENEDALHDAIKLGVALQLTNILRDVGEDWRNGRIYLPLDELHSFGLSESDIEKGIVNDKWRRFMQFQIKRARQLYEESQAGIALLNRDGRFAIAAASCLYREILTEIENLDYDVFNHRAHVSTYGKIKRLPALWWQHR